MEDKTSSGNVAVAENPSSGGTPAKKAGKSKPKSQRSKSSHPPTSEMVNNAIKELKDRKGSSLQAIKKYIASTYKVDGEKLAPFIKRYLKTAVTSGTVVQTKGKGASGSFKLSAPKGGVAEAKSKSPKRVGRKTEAADKKPTEKKPAAAKKAAAKKPAAKKPASKKTAGSPKKVKTPAAKKADAAAKQKAAAQTKSLSKTKNAAKAPAAKTKTPKPKTAKSPKAKAAAKK